MRGYEKVIEGIMRGCERVCEVIRGYERLLEGMRGYERL